MSKGLYADFLLTHLQSANTELFGYALFDGVKHPSIYKELQKSSLEYDTLFIEADLRNQLKKVAPYMIRLDFKKKRSTQESKKLLAHCEKEEALLFTSSLGFKKQLEKMQNIFHLTDEEGNIESYFRFYDSQIFDALTKAQDAVFLSHLFKDSYSYWLQDESSKTKITQYEYKENVLSTKTIDLAQSKGNE